MSIAPFTDVLAVTVVPIVFYYLFDLVREYPKRGGGTVAVALAVGGLAWYGLWVAVGPTVATSFLAGYGAETLVLFSQLALYHSFGNVEEAFSGLSFAVHVVVHAEVVVLGVAYLLFVDDSVAVPVLSVLAGVYIVDLCVKGVFGLAGD